MTGLSILLLATLLSHLSSCRAEFFDEPVVSWTITLPGGGDIGGRGFRKDNAVTVSQDGSSVYCTADDGSLHGLRASDGELIFSYEPTETADGTSHTECRSGVAILEAVGCIVYAVVEIPISGEAQVRSRLVALDFDGTLRWSLSLQGHIVGTPVVGSNGDKIYVSHNVPNDSDTSGFVPYRGLLTIIGIDGDGFDVEAQLSSPPDRRGPFGPLAIQARTVAGVVQDVLFWSESWADGYLDEGHVFWMETNENGNYVINTFSEWGRPSVIQPIVSSDARSLWVGAAGSVLGGWVGESSVEQVLAEDGSPLAPSWNVQLQPSERNETQPFLSVGALSADDRFLFLAGTSYDLFSVNTQTGALQWEDNDGRSVFLAAPKLSEPEGERGVLYAIETLSGNVRQHDAFGNGERIWEFSCGTITGDSFCQDSVESDFSISASGEHLYYGDIYGRVVALQVGTFATPAPTPLPPVAPSSSPVTSSSSTPSTMPILSTTQAPSTMPAVLPTSENTSGRPPDSAGSKGDISNGDQDVSVVIIVIPVVAGVILAGLMLCFVTRRCQRAKGGEAGFGEDGFREKEVQQVSQKSLVFGGESSSALAEEATMTDSSKFNGATGCVRREPGKKSSSPPRTPSTLASTEESSAFGGVDVPEQEEGVEIDVSAMGRSTSISVSSVENGETRTSKRIDVGDLDSISRRLVDDISLSDSDETPVTAVTASPLSNETPKSRRTAFIPGGSLVNRPVSSKASASEGPRANDTVFSVPFDEHGSAGPALYPTHLGLGKATARGGSSVVSHSSRSSAAGFPSVSPSASILSDNSDCAPGNVNSDARVLTRASPTAASDVASSFSFDLADLVSIDGSSLYIEDGEESLLGSRGESASPTPPVDLPSKPEPSEYHRAEARVWSAATDKTSYAPTRSSFEEDEQLLTDEDDDEPPPPPPSHPPPPMPQRM